MNKLMLRVNGKANGRGEPSATAMARVRKCESVGVRECERFQFGGRTVAVAVAVALAASDDPG